jgi:hypothetical protein
MTEQATLLLQKALSLSPEERADLASSLIDSLDPIAEEGVAKPGIKRLPDAFLILTPGGQNRCVG